MLPVNFLKQIIGLYGNSMQAMVPEYLDSVMEAFKRNQQALGQAFSGNAFADIAKRNMAVFEEAAQSFTGGSKKAANASEKELEELRAELAKLQEKVDRLSK
jgi:polyhydroxyalkanoate synthesis regulator protein